MKILNTLLFIFNNFEIPEEFYPPPFLTEIHNGFSTFYSQNVDSQKYNQWMAEKLKNAELWPKRIESPEKDVLWELSRPNFDGLKCESFQNDGYELNATTFCLNENKTKFIVEKAECISKMECSGDFYRKIEIICYENFEKSAQVDFNDNFGINEPSNCENAKIDWIQSRLSKGNNQNKLLTRHELTKGRFYCPSDVSCFKEILFDSFDDNFIKLITNLFIYIFLLFMTVKINKILS